MHPTLTEIPFHRPWIAPRAEEYLQQSLASRRWAGNGPFGKRVRRHLSQAFGGAGIFLTPSCTAALEMSALLLGLQPGDEVIVPAFTFVSTASAYALVGARPVFVDVDPKTLNMDPAGLEAALSPRTRALVPVHYAGIPCDMKALLDFADQHRLEVVEDAAHALYGRHQGRPLGSFGSLATLSFHETKNVSCGEGGALVVNRPDWIERAEIAQEKGTDRSKFLMGLIDKYTWVAPGSSYLLSDLNAAVLLASLEHAAEVQRQRLHLWNFYQSELAAWAARWGVQQPHLPLASEHPAHLYFLVMERPEHREQLVVYLRELQIHTAYHYLPLHLSPMGLHYGGRPGQCPVTESVAYRLVRLPLYAGLGEDEQQRIVEALLAWSPR
jgi:dTDP-4-amino-4,6-dideoxygalactose transaminase